MNMKTKVGNVEIAYKDTSVQVGNVEVPWEVARSVASDIFEYASDGTAVIEKQTGPFLLSLRRLEYRGEAIVEGANGLMLFAVLLSGFAHASEVQS